MKTVLLLGIGHTNAHIVRRWIDAPIENCRLICVSLFPTSTYSGMLPGTLAGQFQDQEMRIDLAELARRAGADFIQASAIGLDLEQGRLEFDRRDPIGFDILSIGVGSKPAGVWQHAKAESLIPIKPMQTFATRLDARVDQALCRAADTDDRPIELAIVGGGVAGVEIALCLQHRLRGQWPERRFSITLYTAGDHVANGMRPRSVTCIERVLRERDITVVQQSKIAHVDDDVIATDDGKEFAADVVIWATGAAAPKVLEALPLEKDERGFIATRTTLQSTTDPRIFAVGDCGTVTQSPSPKAGVYAVRQSPVLWHNINAMLKGEPLKRFQPQQDFLKLVNTGDYKAVLEYRWLTLHARWCWHLKTWIDKRFIQHYQFQREQSGVTAFANAIHRAETENQ